MQQNDMEAKGEFDFIIVGGGTAGLLVAGKLAANPKIQILIVEAGRSHPEEFPEVTTPALAFELQGSKYDWKYESTVIDKPSNRRNELNTRGKVLGGCSSLSYHTFMRGSSATYDEWEAFGGKNWNFEACRDFFDRVNFPYSLTNCLV